MRALVRGARRRGPLLAGIAAILITLAVSLVLGGWAFADGSGENEDLPVIELGRSSPTRTTPPAEPSVTTRAPGTGGDARARVTAAEPDDADDGRSPEDDDAGDGDD